MCDYKNEEKLTQKEIDWKRNRLIDKTRIVFIDGEEKVI